MTSIAVSCRKLRGKVAEMSLPTASGGISRKRFKSLPRNFTDLSGTISLTKVLDMTSLAAYSRLQNATKYCAKVRKTGVADRVE